MRARTTALGEAVELAAARPYSERAEGEDAWHDRLAEWLLARVVRPVREHIASPARQLERILPLVEAHQSELRMMADAGLQARARGLRARLRRRGFTRELAGECFALVGEAASRTTGQRHFETQLMAGWALLQGRLVEMATGEGKTFAATLPACTVAFAGYPVHVITVNDYLADRDAREMAPLYAFLGLDVGLVEQGLSPVERRAAYACAITYCTNKELAFDYLRDRVALMQRSSQLHLALEGLRGESPRCDKLVLRGLHFGIVDEADSVFIDEARTPLILSTMTRSHEDEDRCRGALAAAHRLTAGEHYMLQRAERRVVLHEAGKEYLDMLVDEGWEAAGSARDRDELATQALSALHLFHRDQHYVVVDGKVQIVDESTGRVMPDRSWERGLHQLIEAKEGCALSERRETLARITYQRLFRRYVRLAGMTGTAREVAREVQTIYRLPVVRVPLYRPLQRIDHGARALPTLQTKWNAVADTVARLVAEEQRPVLIGTRSVGASESLSAVLSEHGIAHALLNAKQDCSEAEVIAQAGMPARVTVATNMAGRGTDIRLGAGVAARGGLHVILTEYHESRRIDRQLFGRCARQGDPGSCEAIVSLEDELFVVHASRLMPWARGLLKRQAEAPAWLAGLLRTMAQATAERRNRAVRSQNLKLDRRLEKLLAFSGGGE
jgi:preprotein translocase subunit SecA